MTLQKQRLEEEEREQCYGPGYFPKLSTDPCSVLKTVPRSVGAGDETPHHVPIYLNRTAHLYDFFLD